MSLCVLCSLGFRELFLPHTVLAGFNEFCLKRISEYKFWKKFLPRKITPVDRILILIPMDSLYPDSTVYGTVFSGALYKKYFTFQANPAMRSAVKSVKDGSKGLQTKGKSAYKEMRSKMKNSASNLDQISQSSLQFDRQESSSAPNSPNRSRKFRRELSLTSSGNPVIGNIIRHNPQHSLYNWRITRKATYNEVGYSECPAIKARKSSIFMRQMMPKIHYNRDSFYLGSLTNEMKLSQGPKSFITVDSI